MYIAHEKNVIILFHSNPSKKQVPVFLPAGIQCEIFTAASPGFPLKDRVEDKLRGNDIHTPLILFIVIPGKAQRRPEIQEFFYKTSPKSSKGNHLGNDRLSS